MSNEKKVIKNFFAESLRFFRKRINHLKWLRPLSKKRKLYVMGIT